MATAVRISPCLWFDSEAEQAAQHYTGIFPSSQIVTVSRYGEAGKEIHHGEPVLKFNQAVSFQVHCENQAEIDHYWEKLGAGGDPKAQQCGWLKDKFGLFWQILPRQMASIFGGPSSPTSERAMTAMLRMRKIDIAELKRAAAG